MSGQSWQLGWSATISKEKGVVKGIANAGLDAIPFVGLGKNVVEFFTGDLLPDKDTVNQKK